METKHISANFDLCYRALCSRDPRFDDLSMLVQRCRHLFDLDGDPAAITALLATDPLLAPLVTARPGLRLPGTIDGFELAVRAILGQQVLSPILAERLLPRRSRFQPRLLKQAHRTFASKPPGFRPAPDVSPPFLQFVRLI